MFDAADHESPLRQRALGAFYGLALGDALGMPTQSLSRQQIVATFGEITTLVDARADQPIAPGMPAGSITDDTEQAMLVADLLIDGRGSIDPLTFAERLIAWEDDMRARGSRDLLGPSTQRAVARITQGIPPEEAGRLGATNGAAMRVTPVGIAFDVAHAERFMEAVYAASSVTHNTGLGMAGAASVAATISAGLNGAALTQALDIGVEFAERGERLGYWFAGARLAPRIRWARSQMVGISDANAITLLNDLVGTSVLAQESIVAAFALAELAGDAPQRALCLAASLGGDTDTIAAILGAMLGACAGLDALPSELIDRVKRCNRLDLEPRVEALLALRGSTSS
ncbi:ADP-ribosylglycohydrolase family protein [Salinicola acroporae]|uniref:ADP-ribosylglycohydrolase n=1 Tax=Salinicola acroporae TaxID=1541440 RepID=A0ABT6I8E9_9GAMM|nr:ADP-ribosylglycohydrolase family protein [Salinicola acroporae]MDH4573982.1 ADP-ribosylglycohydrolase [Salinicola acroporae]